MFDLAITASSCEWAGCGANHRSLCAFFMLRREMLSIFRSVYDFKTAHYNKQVRLWRSAADEGRWAANLLWICESDMGKQWSGEVAVSDACLSGFMQRMLLRLAAPESCGDTRVEAAA